jgi:predicted DNA-binding WGR domain protein
MQKHLKFIDGTSDKFWQIEASGLQFIVTYGKNGTSGVSQTKVFDTVEECLKVAEKLLAEKVKKGYSESGEVTVPQKAPSVSSGSKTAAQPKSDLKEVLETYDDIIKNRRVNDLLPFLQEKSKGNKEALKAQIKKAKRYWMTSIDLEPEFVKLHGRGWGQRADDKQSRLIILSSIALFDKTEISSWFEVFRILDETHTEDLMAILEWAKPNWVDTFLLEQTKKNEWFRLTYQSLRTLESKNLIQYNPELFALSLANYNEWHHDNKLKLKGNDYVNYLINDDISIKRDILELFNYETTLHNTTYASTGKNNHISLWETIFTRLLAEGKMDKAFFVENALQIQTKEWNNNLKSFFRKRIEELNLSTDELVQYHETIFSFFHAAYPPIVSYGIELCKNIYAHPNFNAASFLEWVSPVMMRSDCKAGIKILLPILDKMAKEAPQYSNEIAAVLADIFLIADLSLQEKAAKSLLKIGNKNDAHLTKKLAMYAPQMQGNIKSTLADLLEESDALFDADNFENYVFAPTKPLLLTENVVLPQDWNDILFQFGKFISSDDVIDGEILLNTFITQRHLFPNDYVAQLKPYFKQLEGKYFESVFKNYVKSFLISKMANLVNLFSVTNDHYINNKTLKLGKQIIVKVDNKVRNGSVLSLLSMPTHMPHWVEPKTLIERIIAHQNAGESVDILDLSIAISRMPRENVADALSLLPQLDNEMQQLMGYCLGQHQNIGFSETSVLSKLIVMVGLNTKKTENVALWATAARTYYPEKKFKEFEKTYLADVAFVVSPFRPKFYFKEQWNEWKNYQTKALERSPSWFELHFESIETHKNIPTDWLYRVELFSKNSYYDNIHNAADVAYCHSVTPQNTESIAYNLLGTSCRHSNYSSASLKGYLNVVNTHEFHFSDPTTLAFACCFFQEKKEIRFLATEVLINVIQNQTLQTEVFGEKLAFLISNNYGVLLRAVDSIMAIKDVSPLHNSALMQILEYFFQNVEFKDKLPTNFKKLVENYMDLLIKTNQKPNTKSLEFFEKWKENASLKALVKQIKGI